MFKLNSPFKPAGDQPQAIKQLVEGLEKTSGSKPYWALPAAAKPSQWPTLLLVLINRRW